MFFFAIDKKLLTVRKKSTKLVVVTDFLQFVQRQISNMNRLVGYLCRLTQCKYYDVIPTPIVKKDKIAIPSF